MSSRCACSFRICSCRRRCSHCATWACLSAAHTAFCCSSLACPSDTMMLFRPTTTCLQGFAFWALAHPMQQEWLIQYCLLMPGRLNQPDAAAACVDAYNQVGENHCQLGSLLLSKVSLVLLTAKCGPTNCPQAGWVTCLESRKTVASCNMATATRAGTTRCV